MSLDRDTLRECHDDTRGVPYKGLRKRVTSVTVQDNGEEGCGGRDSNPNFLVQRKQPAPQPTHRFVA